MRGCFLCYFHVLYDPKLASPPVFPLIIEWCTDYGIGYCLPGVPIASFFGLKFPGSPVSIASSSRPAVAYLHFAVFYPASVYSPGTRHVKLQTGETVSSKGGGGRDLGSTGRAEGEWGLERLESSLRPVRDLGGEAGRFTFLYF